MPDRQGVACFMSNVSRNGDWTLPRLFRTVCVMGEVRLDLTQIRIAPGTSEIQVITCMGSVKIAVPHNIRVECVGSPVLGEFKVKRVSKGVPSPEAPLLRITGGACMGSVAVRVIDPDAPTGAEKLRRWIEGKG